MQPVWSAVKRVLKVTTGSIIRKSEEMLTANGNKTIYTKT